MLPSLNTRPDSKKSDSLHRHPLASYSCCIWRKPTEPTQTPKTEESAGISRELLPKKRPRKMVYKKSTHPKYSEPRFVSTLLVASTLQSELIDHERKASFNTGHIKREGIFESMHTIETERTVMIGTR